MNKLIVSLLFLILMGFSFNVSSANLIVIEQDSVILGDTLLLGRTSSIINVLQGKDDEKKKRWVSALFAFPFPFGFVGAHRVMLGTKPWIPVLYVLTFGGCFGVLPLIDFCVIAFSKNMEQYENNPSLFMWVK